MVSRLIVLGFTCLALSGCQEDDSTSSLLAMEQTSAHNMVGPDAAMKSAGTEVYSDINTGQTGVIPSVPELSNSMGPTTAEIKTADWTSLRHAFSVLTKDVSSQAAKVRAACNANTECRLERWELFSNEYGPQRADGSWPRRFEASIVLRIPRQDVDGFRSLAIENGTLTSDTTSAQDHSYQVADISKRRAMLEAHQAQLIKISQQAKAVEELLAVSHQLAQTQSELEFLDGRYRSIQDEVSRDTVSIMLSEQPQHNQGPSPILQAVQTVPKELEQNTADAILFVAGIAPWTLAVLAFYGAWRSLRRRILRNIP